MKISDRYEAEQWDRTWKALEELWRYFLSNSPFKFHRYDNTAGQIESRKSV
jgi:hypothetical protein